MHKFLETYPFCWNLYAYNKADKEKCQEIFVVVTVVFNPQPKKIHIYYELFIDEM